MDDEGSAVEEQQPADGRRTPVTQQVGRVAVVAVAVVFVVFAVANAQYVDFSWLVGDTQVVQEGGGRVSGGVPLIVLMLGSFATGALVATVMSWQRHRHRKRDDHRD